MCRRGQAMERMRRARHARLCGALAAWHPELIGVPTARCCESQCRCCLQVVIPCPLLLPPLEHLQPLLLPAAVSELTEVGTSSASSTNSSSSTTSSVCGREKRGKICENGAAGPLVQAAA